MDLKKKIIDLAYKYKLGHIGSATSAVDIIDAIYAVKEKDEKFVLSCGHAGLALFVVLENEGLGNAEAMIKKIGDHVDRLVPQIDCSAGSLGQGLPIAVGMALANRDKNVYCLISDGEFSEGSIYEALCIAAENELVNLKLAINVNGWSAYRRTNINRIVDVFRATGWAIQAVPDGHNGLALQEALRLQVGNVPIVVLAGTKVNHHPALKGLDAHYKIINTKEMNL